MPNTQNPQQVEGETLEKQQQHEHEKGQEAETSKPVFSTNDLSELQADEDEDEDEEQEALENEQEGEEEDAEDDEEEEEEDDDEGNADDHKNKYEPPLKKAKTDATIKPLPTTLPNSDLTRADKTLDEILSMLDDDEFTPIIPDAVTDYYLAKNGFSTSNIKIKRLLALATQKFINDIATDAYEYSRIRSNTAVYNSANPQVRARALLMATVANSKGDNSLGEDGDNNDITNTVALSGQPGGGGGGGQQGQPKVCLKMEDLSSALDEYGLNVNRPQFYR